MTDGKAGCGDDGLETGMKHEDNTESFDVELLGEEMTVTTGMTVWCHRRDCDNLIRNDRDFLGEPPGNRPHVRVQGVPFCEECHDRGPHGGHEIAGVPVLTGDVSLHSEWSE